ncbi:MULTISPECIES: BspA family leucine-rich repeat surface protein [Helicobacter]|uniref:BspA family leucine-rich repeat surface protein n=1 Tax=Helicobacter TaxID=209 RepID=UPI0026033A5C|nr:BspA family leucine-rich repeat surface protein [Helicobacter sp. UBA3407]
MILWQGLLEKIKITDESGNTKYKPLGEDLRRLIKLDTEFTVPLGDIDTSEVTSMRALFENSNRPNEKFQGIETWDTSNVTTMESMFAWCLDFDQDISDWNVEKVKNFSCMFRHAESFNAPIEKWKPENGYNFKFMFWFAKKFNRPLSGWVRWENNKKINVQFKFVEGMFWGAESFNKPLNKWKERLSEAKNLRKMFYGTPFNQDISSWEIGNVESMESMFAETTAFNQDLSSWADRIKNAKTMKNMFYKAKAFNQDLSSWQIPNECDTSGMFKGSKLESSPSQERIKSTKKEEEEDNNTACTIQYIEKSEENKRKLGKFEFKNLEDSKFLLLKPTDDHPLWLHKNLAKSTQVYCAMYQEEEKSTESLGFAIFKILDRYFLLKREGVENESEDIKEKLQDLKGLRENFTIRQSEIEEEDKKNTIANHYFEGDKESLLFTDREITIQKKFGFNSERYRNIILAMIVVMAYRVKMQDFNDRASDIKLANDRTSNNEVTSIKNIEKKTRNDLKSVNDEISLFDLRDYFNAPIATYGNDPAMKNIWNEMSGFYRISETHDELKEVISQISALVKEEDQNKQSLWFSIAAIAIAFVSLIVSLKSLL